MESREKIRVETTLNVPVEKAWECFTEPKHIIKWNFASADWDCPVASNNLYPGGRFNYRMEARDGSVGFDFTGRYTYVDFNRSIIYQIDDKREVSIEFTQVGEETRITETFEAEDVHPVEMQRDGWQAILNNYKKHTEQVWHDSKVDV